MAGKLSAQTARDTSTFIVTGNITDHKNEPVVGAVVLMKQDGKMIAGGVSDIDGNFKLESATSFDSPCLIKVRYLGYKPVEIKNVQVNRDSVQHLAVQIFPDPDFNENETIIYTDFGSWNNKDEQEMLIMQTITVPMVDKYTNGIKKTITSEELKHMPY